MLNISWHNPMVVDALRPWPTHDFPLPALGELYPKTARFTHQTDILQSILCFSFNPYIVTIYITH